MTRILTHPGLDGATQMAIDEAMLSLLHAGREAVLRFYTWKNPTLSLGYFQDYAAVVDEEFCRNNTIDIVRRITGGRAVLHHHEITYAVAAPYQGVFAGQSLRQTYQMIGMALQRGLNLLGYSNAQIQESEAPAESRLPQCFVSVSRYEIAEGLRKVIGSAQKRSKEGFLQHGSILLNFDVRLQGGCVKRPDPHIEQKISPLELALGRRFSFEDLVRTFSSAFEEILQEDCIPSELTASEQKIVSELQIKHRSAPWLVSCPT